MKAYAILIERIWEKTQPGEVISGEVMGIFKLFLCTGFCGAISDRYI